MDAYIFDENEPTGGYTGRIWIKSSTMTAYFKMGLSWIPIQVGNIVDVIDFGKVTLLIDNIDKTDILTINSLTISDVLTSEVNTCSFELADLTGTNKPVVGQEVQVYYKPETDLILIFAGRITDVPQVKIGQGTYSYEVNCLDYTQDLQRNLVIGTYSTQTAGAIIKDIINTYAKSLGTFNVEDGENIEYIAFNYKFPLECIEELCNLTGYDFYVDYEKNVHFFDATDNPAPYSLTDDIANGEYRDLAISIDKSSLINKQTVRGGYQFSELFTEEQVADGIQEAFNLKYEPYTPIKVYVDVGAGYVEKTLGIDNIDIGVDFVVNVNEKNIKNEDHVTLTAGHKIKITYEYKMPVLGQLESKESIAMMKSYEVGDGVYEGDLIIDETIETMAAAKLRARAELNQYSNPLVEGSFVTTQYGYKSGQLLTVNIPSRQIDNEYIIREVTSSSLGNGLFEYEVTFASIQSGFPEFLRYLFDSGKKIFERTDELLSVIKSLEDGFTLEDKNLDHYSVNITTNPYKWCNDAGTTPDKGRYNLCQWK